jgi:hypothetical protein
MLNAWFFGFAMLIVTHSIWFFLFLTVVDNPSSILSRSLNMFIWVSITVAAGVTAYLAKRLRILLAISLSIPATALAGGLNLAYEALGHPVDFPGINGVLLVMPFTLAENCLLCFVGGVVGSYSFFWK